MSAEMKFKKWMKVLIVTFFVATALVILTDRLTPMTTSGRVQGFVVPVAPEVSGYITQVHVTNNQHVKQGDVLFTIDPTKYQIMLNDAELSLRQAKESWFTLQAEINALKENINSSQITVKHADAEYNRFTALFNSSSISESVLEQYRLQLHQAKSQLIGLQQQLLSAQNKLGNNPGENAIVMAASNQLAHAKINLASTNVIAQSNGIVTNLQLHQGSFANANSPLLTLIPQHSFWVSADYREKATALMRKGNSADVVFDALPGQVYKFTLESQDYGVAADQQQGHQLTSIAINNRWVRDAQRVRINLSSEGELPDNLFIGSRATVVIYSSDQRLFNYLTRKVIKWISRFNYIY